METKKERVRGLNESRKGIHDATAGLNYAMEVFGDELAKKQKYKGLDGLEALRYYLMLKHGWLPRDVSSMSLDDMRFALHQEMQGWTLPPAAVF